jgi:hypothetical protein
MTDTKTENEQGKTLGEIAKEILTTPETAKTPEPNNGEMLVKHGLRVMHFRPNEHQAGMTVAYQQTNRNTIQVATAIVHPFDTFTKKVGTRLAIDNFVGGQTAYLPIRRAYGVRLGVTDTLRYYFGG